MRIISLLLIFFLFSSCQDDEFAVSSFDGNVEGILTDGTPFNESFRFEARYTDTEKFEETSKGLQLELIRGLDMGQASPYMKLTVLLKDVGLPTETFTVLNNQDQYADEFELFLRKEVSPTTLMEISSKGFTLAPGFRSMSLEANKTYKFIANSNGDPIIVKKKSKTTSCGGGYCQGTKDYQFLNTSGDTVHFVGSGFLFEGLVHSFQKIVYANGSVSTTDVLYKDLVYSEAGIGIAVNKFLKNTPSGTISLQEFFNVIHGDGTILDYSYNSQKGHLSFTFSIFISAIGFNNNNSTGHDLLITGKFDSGPNKIYLTATN